MFSITTILWLVLLAFGYQTDTNIVDALHAITNKCVDHDAHKECNDYATEALSSCGPGDSQCQGERITQAYEFCRKICGNNDYISDATREFLASNGQAHFLESYGSRSSQRPKHQPAADPSFVSESNGFSKKKRSLRETLSSKVVEFTMNNPETDGYLEPSYDYEIFYDVPDDDKEIQDEYVEFTNPDQDLTLQHDVTKDQTSYESEIYSPITRSNWESVTDSRNDAELTHLALTPELYATAGNLNNEGWGSLTSVSHSFVTIYHTVTSTVTELPLAESTTWPEVWPEPTNVFDDYWKNENENRYNQQYTTDYANYGGFYDPQGYYYQATSSENNYDPYYYYVDQQPTAAPTAPWTKNDNTDPNFGKRLRHYFKLNAALEPQRTVMANSSAATENSTDRNRTRTNATNTRNLNITTSGVLQNSGFRNTIKSPVFIIISVTLFMLIIY